MFEFDRWCVVNLKSHRLSQVLTMGITLLLLGRSKKHPVSCNRACGINPKIVVAFSRRKYLIFFCVQREKAHGQKGGTQASWEGDPWREPPVEMNHAVWQALDQQRWPSPTSSNRWHKFNTHTNLSLTDFMFFWHLQKESHTFLCSPYSLLYLYF